MYSYFALRKLHQVTLSCVVIYRLNCKSSCLHSANPFLVDDLTFVVHNWFGATVLLQHLVGLVIFEASLLPMVVKYLSKRSRILVYVEHFRFQMLTFPLGCYFYLLFSNLIVKSKKNFLILITLSFTRTSKFWVEVRCLTF